jgi:HD-GYP domain-containing protein (c-di-GMP phosphodiesterase class II)
MEESRANNVVELGIQDLRLGMHIILPWSWLKHPFLKNKFVLSSKKEIEKLKDFGISQVLVDLSKSSVVENRIALPEQDKIKPPQKWQPEDIVPKQLIEAVRNKDMPSASKAAVIKESSMVLMNRLLEEPSAENIKVAKQGIFEMVDCIISDDRTTRCLIDITSHDLYTYTHSVNVGFLALTLAKSMFKGSIIHNMRELGAGFFLHDLGKVSIDPAIINKPGRLNEEEMALIRRHPAEGVRMLAKSKQLSEEANIIVMQHHEREDGSGYPHQLKGKQIHIYARICAIADVYDALTSERSYKEKLPPLQALELMRNEMIHHFHREMFEKFVMLFVR